MIAKCLLRQKTQSTLTFDYIVPQDLNIQPMSLVEVPFRNKKVEAIVLELKASSEFANKEVCRALSLGPIMTDAQLKIAGKIAFEFLSDLPSTIFSFLPRLNKKDSLKIGANKIVTQKHRVKKPIIFSGDYELRHSYYIESLVKDAQNLLIFPQISDLEIIRKRILKLNPSLKIELWHSQISSNRKANIIQRLLNNESLIILSTRHGLFLPFTNLELISIDDPSNFAYYEDQSPRYNADHASRIVSACYGAQLIFGDSLPSLESFAWIESRKAIGINQLGKIAVRETCKIEKIFSDEEFINDFDKSKRLLVAGFFNQSQRYICEDCFADNPTQLSCNICKSPKLKTSFFHISKINKIVNEVFTDSASTEPACDKKITIAPFKEISGLSKNYDIAVIPFFDSFASFPFLNFRFKLVKYILDLKQCGVQKIYICLTNPPLALADYLTKNEFKKLISNELINRRNDHLPPFTRAIESTGNEKDLGKIKSIIPLNTWMLQDEGRYINFISHKQVSALQQFISETNKPITLRLDPPEFA